MVNRVELSVTLGDKARPVGRVSLIDDGSFAFSLLFEYTHAWLKDPKSFPISPELALVANMNWVLFYEVRDGKIVRVQNFAGDQHEVDLFLTRTWQLKPIQDRVAN